MLYEVITLTKRVPTIAACCLGVTLGAWSLALPHTLAGWSLARDGIGYLIPMCYLVWSLRYGKQVGPNPWNAKGLEWEQRNNFV